MSKARIAAALSLLVGLVFIGGWIDGQFNASDLRLNASRVGLRMHWGNDVLVMIGLKHHAPSGIERASFGHVPHAQTMTPQSPGYVTNNEILDFGVIYFNDPFTATGYGFTLPMWLPALLFGLVLPVLLLSRGNTFSQTQCPHCNRQIKGTFRDRRVTCPHCGNIFLPLPTAAAKPAPAPSPSGQSRAARRAAEAAKRN